MLKVAQFCKKYGLIMIVDFIPITDIVVIAFYSTNRHESHTIETNIEAMVDLKFEDFLLKQVMEEMKLSY